MRLLITRPEADSQSLVEILAGRSIETLVEPLLLITTRKTAKTKLSKLDIGSFQALLVTSANGVRAFAECNDRRDIKVMAVGDASARAAKEAGFSAIESASGDVEALAALVKDKLDPTKGALLHVAASQVAGDLKGLLEGAGFTYRREVLYEATKVHEFSKTAIAEISSGKITGVVLYSPRTAATFAMLVRKSKLVDRCKLMSAYCLSEAVSAKVQDLPWSSCLVAEKPDQDSLLALLDMKTPEPKQAIKQENKQEIKKDTMSETSENKPSDSKVVPTQNPQEKPDAKAEVKLDVKPEAKSEEKPQASASSSSSPAAQISEKEVPKARASISFDSPKPKENSAAETAKSDSKTAETSSSTAQAAKAAQPSSPAQAKPTAKGGFATGFIGTLAVLGVIAGGAYVTKDKWQPLVGKYVPALGGQSAAGSMNGTQSTQLQQLSDRLNQLENSSHSNTVHNQTLAQLQAERDAYARELDKVMARVDSLETSLAALKKMVSVVDPGTNVKPANDAIAAFQERLSSLEASLGTTTTQDSQALSALSTENSRLVESVEALKERLASLEASDRSTSVYRDQAQALILGVGQLREAMQGSKPFADELKSLASLGKDDSEIMDLVARLQPIAAKGAPTAAALRNRFDGVATEAIRAAAIPGEAESWMQQTISRLSKVVTIRRVGDDLSGNGVDAVVARADNALKNGDLVSALEELKQLDGPPAAAVKSWIEAAQSRVEAERVLAGLHARVLSLSGTSSTEKG